MFRGSANCPICGHSFLSDVEQGARLVGTSPTGMFLDPHLRANHQDYLAWKKSTWKTSIILGIALGLVIDFLIAYGLFSFGVRLPPGRAGGWPFLVGFFAGLPIPRLLLNRWGTLRFKREWNERGGIPAPQTETDLLYS